MATALGIFTCPFDTSRQFHALFASDFEIVYFNEFRFSLSNVLAVILDQN